MSFQVLIDFEETLNVTYILEASLTEFAWVFSTFPILDF